MVGPGPAHGPLAVTPPQRRVASAEGDLTLSSPAQIPDLYSLYRTQDPSTEPTSTHNRAWGREESPGGVYT